MEGLERWDQPARGRPIRITQEMLAENEPAQRIDFEKGMSYTPKVSIVLILVNTAIFAHLVFSGALASREALIEAGALARQRVLQGEVWRLASALFLHGSPGHLAGNALVLFIVGMACEHAFGPLQTLVIFLVTGICGSVLSMIFHPGPSLGASGAVFGVLGCVGMFFYRHHRVVMLRDKRIGFVLLAWAVYQILTGLFNPIIDNFAHIGGFVSGMLAAWVLWPRLVPRPETPSRFQV